MTREQLVEAIFDSAAQWSCPESIGGCCLPDREGNASDCCKRCAEKQLTEYEENLLKSKKKTGIFLTEEELDMIAICAERYALGRMTYIVGEVCGFIECHMKDISTNALFVLINDIQDHPVNGYGMECDKEHWMNVLSKLRMMYLVRKER